MAHIRSWMFVPGYQQRMIDKAFTLPVDAAILDLEDSVTPDKKSTARLLIAGALEREDESLQRFVRVNAPDTIWFDDDLRASVRPGLAGLMIPKVHSADDIDTIDTKLAECENAAGLPEGSTRLIAVIESARGLVQAPAIAGSSPRLMALMFGAEDFALDLGIIPSQDRDIGEMLYARSATAIAAASAGLQAIDRIVKEVDDNDRLIQDTRQARELGFTGKAIIHPRQIEPVHEVFTPTEEEVAYARRIVTAYDEATANGDGAIAVDGRLIDQPVVAQAQRILDTADEKAR